MPKKIEDKCLKLNLHYFCLLKIIRKCRIAGGKILKRESLAIPSLHGDWFGPLTNVAGISHITSGVLPSQPENVRRKKWKIPPKITWKPTKSKI